MSYSKADCLAGGGELGALMRSADWSNTPLGPVDNWPQSLKTAVSIILNSHQPMWLGWGSEMTFLYNDAYIPVLSLAKHPWALGKPAAIVWAEIWDICGPLADKVFAKGEATFMDDVRLFMNRGDFLEEKYYSFSYSPIRDESGDVGGLFCPNTDGTAKVLNARRLRTLSDLSSRVLVERSTQAACAAARVSLAKNLDDIPFSLLYLFDGAQNQQPHLVESTGFRDGETCSQDWPIAEVMRTGQSQCFALTQSEPLPIGLAGQRVSSAMVLPVTSGLQSLPLGILVAGVNPAQKLDAEYQAFFSLVADQIASAIQNARAVEEEKKRADILAKLDRDKTAFFSNVSHEFRTPLTLMLGPAEEVISDGASPASNRQRAEVIQRNALRLLKLVNTLLDFSRIESGRMEARFEAVDLAALTADLASSFRSACEKAGLTLEVRCAALAQPVYVDRDMWEKVVLNLLSNAFKFTFKGGIEVTLAEVEGQVLFEVRDTGVGIPQAEIPRLFERFYRVANTRSRSHEGSGIGLALVSEVVRMHGGNVGARSEIGRGSVISITLRHGCDHLPKNQVAGEAAHRTGASAISAAFQEEAVGWLRDTDDLLPEEPVGPGDSPPGTVLIVDDNADMREYIAGLMRNRWAVRTATDGEDALAEIGKGGIDLVLTDVMMPRLDGFGLLKAIKSGGETRELPVIMVSARAGEESRIEGLDAGADDYLVKPFTARELVARVKSQLKAASERKLIAHERARLLASERLARDLAELERKHLHTLFMQAPTPICILRGRRHVIELANQAICKVWGKEQESIIGHPLMDAVPELRGQEFVGLLDGVMKSGVPYEGKEAPAKLDINANGRLETVLFNFVYTPLRNVDNAIDGVMVIAFDVTDEVRAREQLAGLQQRAETANRAKDEFLAMLGHELRNPLSPILTALQVMRLRGMKTEEQNIVERQVGNLIRLVDDLLDVSRIATGKIQLRKRTVELAEVVAKAIETTRPLIEKRNHWLDVDVAAAGLVVDADPDRLAQVISNLLTNASKYSEPGSRIVLRAARADGRILLHVRDHGVGIAADMIGHIFDLFVQQPQTIDRAQGGLGLGLAIVRNLTALHGGTVRVRSDGPAQGSEFTIDLPATGSDRLAPDERLPAPSRNRENAAAARILVVDDNIDAAEMLKLALQLMGHTVETANDGPHALRIAPQFDPDIALLDIGLPVMDGYQLAEELRNARTPDRRPLRLVAVTGYGLESDKKRSAAAGFHAHLVKPIDIAQLTVIVEEERNSQPS